MTLAPRSWPSWPILTTSMRGRRPSDSAKASTSCCTWPRRPRRPRRRRRTRRGSSGSRPCGGRTPSPWRRLISPTVARARAASTHRASRLPSPAAPSVRRLRAAWQAASSRSARTRSSRAICWLADLGVVDGQHVDVLGVVGLVLVDADDDLLAPVDAGLAPGGRLLDAQLGHARGDRLGHAAERLDLLDQRPGASSASSLVSAST